MTSAKSNFDKFKVMYPNHPLEYNPKLEAFYQRKIEEWRDFIPTKIDQERLEEYQNWSSSRRPKTLSDLPISALNKIIPAALELIARGHTQAELTGSFARGDYLTEADPKEYWQIKANTGRKVKLSDVDVIIYFPDKPTLSDALNPYTHLYNKHEIPLIRDGHISHDSSYIASFIGSRLHFEQPIEVLHGQSISG